MPAFVRLSSIHCSDPVFIYISYFFFFYFNLVSGSSKGGGGGDFIAGFLLGGALFGTLAYVFAPQVICHILLA